MARRKGLQFYQKERKLNSDTIKDLFEMLIGTIVAVFLASALVYYLGLRTSVIGNSMEPTLLGGQEILINRFRYLFTSPDRGEVVVFLPNGNTNSHYYVKRIIALPGENVQIIDGQIYIDGVMAAEDERFDEIADPGIAENEIHLGEEEYFVLGDNRNSSEDSRSGNIGAVKENDIIGKAWFHFDSETMGIGFVE